MPRIARTSTSFSSRSGPNLEAVHHAGSRGLAAWQCRSVVVHIELNQADLIDVETLASLCRLSVSHFTRAFRTTFGSAPYSYIVRKRVDSAKTMMATTDEPLSQIALACGFSDQAHFCNHFRRLVGCSPLEWRRRRQRESAAFRGSNSN